MSAFVTKTSTGRKAFALFLVFITTLELCNGYSIMPLQGVDFKPAVYRAVGSRIRNGETRESIRNRIYRFGLGKRHPKDRSVEPLGILWKAIQSGKAKIQGAWPLNLERKWSHSATRE